MTCILVHLFLSLHKLHLRACYMSKLPAALAHIKYAKLSCVCLMQFHKPEYARKPIVQDTFYRRTTAFAPQGGIAVAASG